MHGHRVSLPFLLLLLPCISPLEGAAQETTLRFAWPRGTEAHVRATQMQDRVAVGPPRTLVLSAEFDMTLREHPRGLLIDYSNARTTDFRATPELPEALRAMMERLGALAPDDVVSSDGELVEVGGLEEVTRVVRDMIQPALDSLAGKPGFEEVQAMVESLVSEEQLLIAAQDHWAAQTGIWAGRTLVPGQPVRLTSEAASPLAAHVMIPVTVDLLLAGAVPCPDETGGTGCVRLELTASADPRGLESAFREALSRSGYPETAPLPIDKLTQETRATVVAEPTTLLPHTLDITKVVEGTINRGYFTHGFRQVEQMVMEYEYR